MKVTVRYYGMLAEFCQTQQEIREVQSRTVGELRKELEAVFWVLGTTPFQVAKGTQLCTDASPVAEGDELVLLPPFAGG